MVDEPRWPVEPDWTIGYLERLWHVIALPVKAGTGAPRHYTGSTGPSQPLALISYSVSFRSADDASGHPDQVPPEYELSR